MYLLFDIGGTKMRLAVSDGEKILRSKIVPSTPEYSIGLQTFLSVATELLGGQVITGVAGGVAGPLDPQKTMLVGSPNLQGWVGKPLKEDLIKLFNVPVFLENDAAIVGLGEAVHGAGKDFDIVVYLTISTGVGGARIVNKKIEPSTYGFEPGHQIIDKNGPRCPTCNAPGDLEGYISGRALEEKFGSPPALLTDKLVWEYVAENLAYGLNNITVLWSPEIVILGGAVSSSIDLEMVKEQLKNRIKIFPMQPILVKSQLGDEGGFYGALSFLQQKLQSSK